MSDSIFHVIFAVAYLPMLTIRSISLRAAIRGEAAAVSPRRAG